MTTKPDFQKELAKLITAVHAHKETPFNTIQALIELVAEAQLSILRGFRRRDFASGDFYEHAIHDRIEALSSNKQGGSK